MKKTRLSLGLFGIRSSNWSSRYVTCWTVFGWWWDSPFPFRFKWLENMNNSIWEPQSELIRFLWMHSNYQRVHIRIAERKHIKLHFHKKERILTCSLKLAQKRKRFDIKFETCTKKQHFWSTSLKLFKKDKWFWRMFLPWDVGRKICRRIDSTTQTKMRSSKHTHSCIQETCIHQLTITWKHCMWYRGRRFTWQPLKKTRFRHINMSYFNPHMNGSIWVMVFI